MVKVNKIGDNIIEVDGQRYVKEDSQGWLDVSDVLGEGYQVELEVHDKNKSWDKLELSKREEELLTAEQCFLLTNSKYAKQLKIDGSSSNDDFFIKQPFDFNRKKGYVAGFCAGSDGLDLDCYYDSSGCSSTLGVRFVKKIKKKKN